MMASIARRLMGRSQSHHQERDLPLVRVTSNLVRDAVVRDHSAVSLRALQTLLAGWVVATIVPGVIAAVAWDLDTNSTDLGGPLAVWLAGYLLQLGLFMAISRR